MTKKEKHYLELLIEKSEKQQLSAAEQNLLDDFFQHEYDHAVWNTEIRDSKAHISANIYQNVKKKSQLKKHFYGYYKYAIAATVILIATVGILMRPQANVKEITVSTTAFTDSVKLNDGTTVYLAANSTFKYPENFGHKSRTVNLLKGNAFFKVAKDPAHPFIISSAGMTTKVLGTSFHIGLGDHKSSVSVITGKVQVSSEGQVAVLKANEKAVFSPEKGLEKQKMADLSLYNWYKKDISLNNVTLDKVFTLLSFKYGTSFKTEDQELLNTRITLYVKNGLSLQSILDQINYITHLKLITHGNKIESIQ